MLAKDFLISSNANGVTADKTVGKEAHRDVPLTPPKQAATSSNDFTDFEDSDDDDEYVAPTQKHSVYSKNVHLKFVICTSWGYKNVFNQYHQLLAQRYGENVQLSVENYPVPKIRQTIATILSMAKMFLLYIVISGTNPMAMFGQADAPMPEWLAKMQESKIYTCIMIFFSCNALESFLISTGAFEIYANGDLIYSKLQEGQVPQPPSIMAKIDELLGKPPGSDNFGSTGF